LALRWFLTSHAEKFSIDGDLLQRGSCRGAAEGRCCICRSKTCDGVAKGFLALLHWRILAQLTVHDFQDGKHEKQA